MSRHIEVKAICSCLQKQGPRNGAMTNKQVAGPRSEAVQISAIVPPPMLNAGLPNIPAKNRQTNTAAILFATAEPIKNSIAEGKAIRYIHNRPTDSLKGAPNIGPTASPKQNNETPSKETVCET